MSETPVDLMWTFFLGTVIVLTLISAFLIVVILSQRQKVIDRNERVKILEESKKKIEALLNQSEAMQRNLTQFSQEIIRVQEEERSFIGRELHDQIGQILATVAVNLEVIRNEITGSDPSVRKRMLETQSLIQQTFDRVRGILSELRTVAISQIGLVGAIRNYTDEFSNRTGITVDFVSSEDVEKLNSEQKLTLYRVIQEGLTNVMIHARAKRVIINISRPNSTIHMKIQDDGRGFDVSIVQNPSPGSKVPFGLLGMQERIKLVRGEFTIASEIGKGTSIDVEIPLQQNSDQA
jgi:signal transduction histidine kinase